MSILDTERQLMAVCQPITGDRASGTVIIKAAGDTAVSLPFGSYLFPIVNGQVRYELAFKVAKSTATDGSWTIGGGGAETEVAVFSNIGGERHNLPKGTRFVLDQPMKPQLAAGAVTRTGTTGATDPNGDLALYNFVSFESFGSKPSLELFKSGIGGRFPAAIIHWIEDEPADGMTTSSVSRPTHRGRGVMSYLDLFEILVVSNRSDAEHERRGQGLRVLDEMTALLIDRMAVDGQGMSSPGGLHIKRRYRAGNGEDGFYKAFQVYALQITAQVTITQRDTRVYDELKTFRIDAPREDTPVDLPLVVNNLVTNPQT